MIAAIVPAAGLSVRMGRPKLALDMHGRPVIAHVVRALVEGGADRVYAVVPPPGQEGAERVRDAAVEAGAVAIVLPAPTADMRATVEYGLLGIASQEGLPEGLLIAPGDAVGMSATVVAEVLARFRSDPSRIVVPRREGSRGHPLALPWGVARAIPDLPPGVGVNAIVRNHQRMVDEIAVDEPGPDSDLDTPEDYERLTRARSTDPRAIP